MLDETGFYAPSMAGHFCVFKHNPTVSKQLRYSLTREYTCPYNRAAVRGFNPSRCGSIPEIDTFKEFKCVCARYALYLIRHNAFDFRYL